MGSLAQASGINFQGVPLYLGDKELWLAQIASVVNQLLQGRSLNTGSVTLTANAASTDVTDFRVGPNSFIGFMPTTANASASIAAGTQYISARGKQTFTITHANNAQTDRTFTYVVIG